MWLASLKTRTCALAARCARVLRQSRSLQNQRGRRECRVKASPMARQQQEKLAAVTTGSAGSSGIPCATVLRLIRALLGDRAFLPPSPRVSYAKLDLSVGRPGPHDFAVRADDARRASPPRPSHPASTSVTTRTP